jgi:hypothetical protein
VACGAAATDANDNQGASESELSEPGLIGDRGPGWDTPETDPTLESPLDRGTTNETPVVAPPKKVLDFTWNGQETSYWCGPGSTRMAIGSRMGPPTQQELATFMGTTTEGTARVYVVDALNHWLTPTIEYKSVPVDMVPTQAQRDLLKKSIVERLASGYPVVANVLSGWRPPGYPTGTIGHFVAVMGYDENGEKILIADPAGAGAAGPRWKNVPKTYWITLQVLGT